MKLTDLSKDEIVMVALELDISDNISLSLICKEINRKLCQNDMFWIQKVTHDYNVFYNSGSDMSPRNFYYYTAVSLFKNKLGLKESVDQIMKMTKLYLSGENLKKIPKEIGFLTDLQKIWLDNNQLKEIPKEIGFLRDLRMLWLNNNQLKEIPKEIGLLTDLRIVTLFGNKLTKDQISEIEKLLPNTNIYAWTPRVFSL